jgi:hypothetical protein
MLIPEKSRKDAEPISAFLSFGSVRIENPNGEIAGLAVHWAEQDAIRTYAVISVTNPTNDFRIGFTLEFYRTNHDVIVTQGMIFRVSHLDFQLRAETACSSAFVVGRLTHKRSPARPTPCICLPRDMRSLFHWGGTL